MNLLNFSLGIGCNLQMKENVECTFKCFKLEALKSFQRFLAEHTVLLVLLSKNTAK